MGADGSDRSPQDQPKARRRLLTSPAVWGVAFLVLLARLLTDRRDVASIVALLALVDGAGFVQSRIGMNDVYLLAAFLAAAALFVAILQRRIVHPLLVAAALGGTGLLLYVLWANRTYPGMALAFVGVGEGIKEDIKPGDRALWDITKCKGNQHNGYDIISEEHIYMVER